MNKAIIYVRCSTGDQKTSIEDQQIRLIEYCKFKGLEIVSTIIDEDVSGGKPFYERPGGIIAKKLFSEGVRIIVVLKIDRIFRSVKDSLITVDEWNKQKIALHISDMGGNSLDVTTALGRLFFIQAVSMGEFERRLTADRTKDALSHKKKQGKVYCANVYGWTNSGGELLPIETEQVAIKIIKELSGNLTPKQIATALNEKGIKPRSGMWRTTLVENILKNKLNY